MNLPEIAGVLHELAIVLLALGCVSIAHIEALHRLTHSWPKRRKKKTRAGKYRRHGRGLQHGKARLHVPISTVGGTITTGLSSFRQCFDWTLQDQIGLGHCILAKGDTSLS